MVDDGMMIMMMVMVVMFVMLVMMGSSVAIFGLLLKVWVVAGLCGGGALGGERGQSKG